MAPGGRLLIFDFAIPPGSESGVATLADVFIMALIRRSADRTETPLRTLLQAVGLRLDRLVPLPAGPALLEASAV